MTYLKDIECPYCGYEEDINHDDGYGYEEDEMWEQECSKCEMIYGFTTSISFHYTAHRIPCFNGHEHKWKLTHTHPIEYSRMRCEDCGYESELDERFKQQLIDGVSREIVACELKQHYTENDNVQ